jgi:DNA-directed RNA polymerase specialized sigma24 family protein
LPWEPRLAVELFYVLGLDVAECAAVMRCDDESVTATLAAARDRLIDGVEEIELS